MHISVLDGKADTIALGSTHDYLCHLTNLSFSVLDFHQRLIALVDSKYDKNLRVYS